MPVIGDLFRAKPEDIENTLISVYHMMKQNAQAIDFRQDIRGKLNKLEATNRELSDQLKQHKLKNEQHQNDNKNQENRIKI